jgi:hypothetical protein
LIGVLFGVDGVFVVLAVSSYALNSFCSSSLIAVVLSSPDSLLFGTQRIFV